MVIGCLVLLHVMVLFLVLHAWYLNTTMAPIFQKMNELWDFYQPVNLNQNVRIWCQMKNVQLLFYYTVTLLKMLTCNLLNDADVRNNNLG